MKTVALILACSCSLNLVAKPNQSTPKEIPLAQLSCGVFKPRDVTFQFYGQCLYLQPTGTNLYYGAQAIGINPDLSGAAAAASPDWLILKINPDYHFGFEVGTGLSLNDANIDLNVNWERVHAQDSKSYQASPAAGVMVGPFFDIGPNSSSYKVAKGKLTSHFDAANLTFGKNFCFFSNFFTHFYGGAGFARIKQTLFTSYSNTADTIYRHIESSSKFTGAGPQIGLDYDYRICKGFLFTGKSVLSLLMGQMKSGTTYQSLTPESPMGLPQPNVQTTTVPSTAQLIPSFEQHLGFSYLAQWDSVKALFEIGYRCQIYLNAIQTTDMASQAIPPDIVGPIPNVGVFAVGFQQTNGNFILTGPYASAGIEF